MAPKALLYFKLQKLHWTLSKESMSFLSVPPLITRIYPSTHQAPLNIWQSKIVIHRQLVISEKLTISAIKSNFFTFNSSFGFVGDTVYCALQQCILNKRSICLLGLLGFSLQRFKKKNYANNSFKDIAPVKSIDLLPDHSFSVN